VGLCPFKLLYRFAQLCWLDCRISQALNLHMSVFFFGRRGGGGPDGGAVRAGGGLGRGPGAAGVAVAAVAVAVAPVAVGGGGAAVVGGGMVPPVPAAHLVALPALAVPHVGGPCRMHMFVRR